MKTIKNQFSKMEIYSRLGEEYNVSMRTIMRWKTSGCDILNPQSIAEFALSSKTLKSKNILQKISDGGDLFLLEQIVNINDFNKKEKKASISDRLKAKLEAAELRKRAEDLEYFAKNGVRKNLRNRSNDLYLMKNKRNGLYKIGISIDPSNREKTLQAQEPEIKMVKSWDGQASKEKWWHNHFKEYRVRGEWFELTSQQIRFMIYKMNDTGK